MSGCVKHPAEFLPLPVLRSGGFAYRGRVGVGVERRTAEGTPTLALPLNTGRGDKRFCQSQYAAKVPREFR
jgi:hypothetical protein